jgi:hypothetical protein
MHDNYPRSSACEISEGALPRQVEVTIGGRQALVSPHHSLRPFASTSGFSHWSDFKDVGRSLPSGPLQLGGKRTSAILASLGSIEENLKRRHPGVIDAAPLQINSRAFQQENRALSVVSGKELFHESNVVGRRPHFECCPLSRRGREPP